MRPLLALVLVGSVVGCFRVSADPADTKDPSAPASLPTRTFKAPLVANVWEEDKLKAALKHKSSEDAIETIGRPTKTETKGNKVTFYYRAKLINTFTNKEDDLQLTFTNNVLTEVKRVAR